MAFVEIQETQLVILVIFFSMKNGRKVLRTAGQELQNKRTRSLEIIFGEARQ